MEWGYGKANGPVKWGDLCEAYEVCKLGQTQSPIDLPELPVESGPSLDLRYHVASLNVVNNGHAIQMDCPAGSSIEIENDRYELKQFHFHGLSEHTVAGRAMAMECHFVHVDATGNLAVVGLFLEEGDDNPALEPLWSHLPQTVGERIESASEEVDVAALLPERRSYFTYVGSLTTPPCSENVRWFVFDQAIPLSNKQLNTFRTLYADNYRPVQPLEGRSVRRIG